MIRVITNISQFFSLQLSKKNYGYLLCPTTVILHCHLTDHVMSFGYFNFLDSGRDVQINLSNWTKDDTRKISEIRILHTV